VYGWLWRRIPGGVAAKISGCATLLLAALALLFFVVFPWVEPRLPWNDVTVNSPSVQPQAVPSASPTAAPSAARSAPSALPSG
jgi:hypothetical protein